jgi:SRSO17 transposase
MALVKINSGCKVGWYTYDDKVEAEAAAAKARRDAVRQAQQGYDFGYQIPGETRDNKDGTFTVTVP